MRLKVGRPARKRARVPQHGTSGLSMPDRVFDCGGAPLARACWRGSCVKNHTKKHKSLPSDGASDFTVWTSVLIILYYVLRRRLRPAGVRGALLPSRPMAAQHEGAALALVQFAAVLRKNWLVTLRKPWEFARDFAFPLALVLLLCAVRSRLENNNYDGHLLSAGDFIPVDALFPQVS